MSFIICKHIDYPSLWGFLYWFDCASRWSDVFMTGFLSRQEAEDALAKIDPYDPMTMFIYDKRCSMTQDQYYDHHERIMKIKEHLE